MQIIKFVAAADVRKFELIQGTVSSVTGKTLYICLFSARSSMRRQDFKVFARIANSHGLSQKGERVLIILSFIGSLSPGCFMAIACRQA